MRVESHRSEHVYLLTIPLSIRFKTLKRYFITGGLQYDHDFSRLSSSGIDNQTGFGVHFRAGKAFPFGKEMLLSISSEIYITQRCTICLWKNPQRLLQIGLQIDYKFGS